MESVVAAAIGILTVVVFVGLLGLLCIVRHRYCGLEERDVEAIEMVQDDALGNPFPSAHHLTEVPIAVGFPGRSLHIIAEHPMQIDNTSRWLPHCQEIFRTSHQISKEIGVSVIRREECIEAEKLKEVFRMLRSVGSQADDVENLLTETRTANLEVLEPRCAGLVLSVERLVLTAEFCCGFSANQAVSVDATLNSLKQNLQALRDSDHSRPRSRHASFRIVIPRDKIPTVNVTDTTA